MCIMLLNSNANNLHENEKVFMPFQFYIIRIGNHFFKELLYFEKENAM